jgi:hypothetical protein
VPIDLPPALPAPLTPPDCDLRGLTWMRLDGDRLFASDTWLHASPIGRNVALVLWWASWKQCPAASLPASDVALAQIAGYGFALDAFLAIKEEAMRGFVLCSDGRLYHPVVAKLALEAFELRSSAQSIKDGREDRLRRHREDRARMFDELHKRGVHPEWNLPTDRLRALLAAGPSSPDTLLRAEAVAGAETPATSQVPGPATPATGPATRPATALEEKGREEKKEKKDSVSPDGDTAPAPPAPQGGQKAVSVLPEKPVDARSLLFGDNLRVIKSVTGRSDDACRKFFGKMLASLKDDAAVLNAIIAEMQAQPPLADPTSWLAAAVKERSAQLGGAVRGGKPEAFADIQMSPEAEFLRAYNAGEIDRDGRPIRRTPANDGGPIIEGVAL